MISEFISIVSAYSTIINFFCYIFVFLGGLYVAMHSRILPKWAITSIWYLGLSSFFVAVTIIVEWIFGQHHPFSHFMMGDFGEMIININLCAMVFFLFFHTLYHDFMNKRGRKLMRRKEDRLEI
jgi:hypothetical protein